MREITRLCGCTTAPVSMPTIQTMVTMFTVGCEEHGFDDWESVDLLYGKGEMPFPMAVSAVLGSIADIGAESGERDYVPHRNMFLFTRSSDYRDIVGLIYGGHRSVDIVWDPCPMRPNHYHSRASALKWVLGEMQSEGFEFGVISLN